MKGTIYVLLSAVCFSTGGVLIKSIPWSSITIQGIRSIFSFMLIASYMVITKRKFVWNKTVLFGAVCNTAMALTFVSATKMTTAANAIVLQFTEPIFVILLMWALYKKKPKKAAVVACAEENDRVLVHMAMDRLMTPIGLTEKNRLRYEKYLVSVPEKIFEICLKNRKLEWLKFSVNSVLAGGKIETTVKEKALVTYVQQDWTEGAAVLLAAGRKKEGGKKARYEFE